MDVVEGYVAGWGVAGDVYALGDSLLALVSLAIGVFLILLGALYWFRRVPPSCFCAVRSQATRLSKNNFYVLHEYVGMLMVAWGFAYAVSALVFFLLPVMAVLFLLQLFGFAVVSVVGLILLVALTVARERRLHRGSIGVSDLFDTL